MPPMLGNLIKGFPEWGQQSNGIAQYTGKRVHQTHPFLGLLIDCIVAWTAFCAEGLGCSLQHYQKGLTERINAEWGLPSHWVLSAQLVFGTPNGPPRGGVEKQFADIEPRVKVFGSTASGK